MKIESAPPVKDSLPPHAPEAELGILGCILLNPAASLPQVAEAGIVPGMFYDLRHRRTFEAMLYLHAEGVGLDVITLQERLKELDLLEQVGGIGFLATLPDTVPSAANLTYYFKPLREAHQKRTAIALGHRLMELANDAQVDPAGLCDDLRSMIDGLEVRTACRYAARQIGDIQPLPGDDADELLRHRFLCRGSGLLLAAPSGVGKSTFALQAMLCFAVGRACFGFKPTRPLRSLYIQAENDEGDLRELRDGILTGLHFSESERAQAFANVQFVTIDDLCGAAFIREAVAPLCREHKPDVLWLDPLLAYLGGDVGRQEIVSPFLRNELNPVLHRYAVACVVVHHTNKPPSGREKPNWQAGDFAYIGSGSAELANWPRAVVAIRSTGSHEVFELRLGKRGSRVGWKDLEGSPCYSKFIAHGKDGIYWREADQAEQPAPAGRKQEHTIEEVVALLDGQQLLTADWQKLSRAEAGISERSFYRLKKQAESARLVSQSKLDKKWFKNP